MLHGFGHLHWILGVGDSVDALLLASDEPDDGRLDASADWLADRLLASEELLGARSEASEDWPAADRWGASGELVGGGELVGDRPLALAPADDWSGVSNRPAQGNSGAPEPLAVEPPVVAPPAVGPPAVEPPAAPVEGAPESAG